MGLLVVGLGNILLKDEGVGVHVVNSLRDRPLPENVTLMDGGTRGPFRYIGGSADLGISGQGDFDGDGKTDLLWELSSTSANFITLMDGGTRGSFQYIPNSRGGTLEIIAP